MVFTMNFLNPWGLPLSHKKYLVILKRLTFNHTSSSGAIIWCRTQSIAILLVEPSILPPAVTRLMIYQQSHSQISFESSAKYITCESMALLHFTHTFTHDSGYIQLKLVGTQTSVLIQYSVQQYYNKIVMYAFLGDIFICI